jgi:hypothetical protein
MCPHSWASAAWYGSSHGGFPTGLDHNRQVCEMLTKVSSGIRRPTHHGPIPFSQSTSALAWMLAPVRQRTFTIVGRTAFMSQGIDRHMRAIAAPHAQEVRLRGARALTAGPSL